MNEEREPSGLARQYQALLAADGYKPRIDDDGDVVFKHEGKTYYVDIHDVDTQAFSVVLPNFWSIDDEEELQRAVRAANNVNSSVKAAKLFVLRDTIMMARVDLLVESATQAMTLLQRVLSILQMALHEFGKIMREAQDVASADPFDLGRQFGDPDGGE